MYGTNRYTHTCLKCFVLHKLLRLIPCALEITMATTYCFTNWASIVNRHIKTSCSLTMMLLKLARPPSVTNRSKGVGGMWKIHMQGRILLTGLFHIAGPVEDGHLSCRITSQSDWVDRPCRWRSHGVVEEESTQHFLFRQWITRCQNHREEFRIS